MRTRFVYAAMAFLLGGVVAADAAELLLYNANASYGQSSYPRRRSQHFSATQSTPNSVPVGYLFDKAAMRVEVQTGSTWTFALELYSWHTDYATTLVPANLIATTGDVTVSGETRWIEVDLTSNPQDASGQYLLSLNIKSGDSFPCSILYDPVGDGGTNNDAYTDATLRTDREFQVRLNVYPNPSCVTPFTISAVTMPDGSPAAFSRPPSPGIQRLKATGTGLDNVTSVILQQGLAAPITGSIVSQSATEFQADFDLSPTSVTPGSYKMVATGGPSGACVYQFDSAVTITCSQPDTVVLAIQNAAGLTGTSAHTMTLIGTNLEYLAPNGVNLVKARGGSATIPGTATYNPSTTDLNVVFNLTGAEGGRYNIILTRNAECGSVSSAVPLSGRGGGFLVYMPALTNAGFEEGYTTDPTTGTVCESSANDDRPKAKHWDQGWSPETGGFVRDGSQWKPCVTNPTPPPAQIQGGVTGAHYGSMQYPNSDFKLLSFFQTIAAPDVSEGPYSVYADIAMQSLAQMSGARIRLLDGTDTGELINGPDNLPLDPGGTIIPNTFLYYGGTDALVRSADFVATVPQGYVYQSNPPLLTIEFMLVAAEGDTGSKALHVDAVRNTLEPPPPCNTPRQDVDGDNDVDLADFNLFQSCFNGPNRPYKLPPGFDSDCKCLDVDPGPNGDGDVDLADFGKFQGCFNGPNRPPKATCGT